MSSKHALNNTAPQDFDGAESQDVVVVNAVDEDHGKLRSKNSKADLKQTSGENVPSTEEGSADVNTAQDGDGPAKDVQPPKVGFFNLFQYADKLDLLLIVVATLSSIAHGLMLGLFSLVFGDALDSFTGPTDNVMEVLKPVILKFLYLGIASLFISYAQVAFFNISASRQAARIRKLYFKVILGQDMAWYDSIDSGELTSRVAGDVVKIEQGIGDKVGSFLQFFSMAIGGFLIGFIKGWKLALVILSVTPLLGLSGAFLGKIMAESATEGMSAYAKAGAIAEEVIGLIRVVVAFGGQPYEAKRYSEALGEAKRVNSKRGYLQGFGLAVTMGVMIATYALGFWYGNRLVQSGELSPGAVVTVFFSVVFAAFGLGQGASSLPAFAEAQGSAYHIFKVIKRGSEIDSLQEDGEVPEDIQGEIEFDNVEFTYAGRPDRLILDKMSFKIERGKTLALVGHSGCGKSTCIQLLERFYDPLSGSIRLDGKDIRELNVQWLRSHIGIVSQMPILFARTIAENIAAGAGLELNPDYANRARDPLQLRNRMFRKQQVSQDEIVAAAKMANAHDFIMRLPNGYDTLIGERGAQLSGGQKQRIAIARALVRNPRVMLLDEATSALDSRSERVVQEALERAAQGRSTIVIAHRLSTVQNADMIGVVDGGRIVELGTHQELLAKNGRYAAFVRLQDLRSVEEEQAGEAAGESEGSTDDDDVVIEDDPLRLSGKHFISHPSTTSRISTASSKHHDADAHGRSHTSLHHGEDGDLASPALKRLPKGGWGSKLRRPGLFRKKKKVDEAVDVDEADPAKPKEEPIVDPGVVSRAFNYNRHEWHLVLLGSIGQMGMGCLWPVFSVLFADIIAVMLQRDDDKVRFWVIMYVVLAIIAFVLQWTAVTPFVLSGERLTYRLRQASFEAILRQDIGWFDDRGNSVGALSARLSTEANSVRNLTGERVGSFINIVATIVAGLGIAFWACPKLAAVILLVIPMVAVGGAIQLKIMVGFQGDGLKMFERAGKVATEAVEGVRTVISNNCTHDFMDNYAAELDAPFKSSIKISQVAGLAFGWSEFFTFLMWSISFGYGGYLVQEGEAEFADMMKAISAIAFGAMMLGQVAAMIPDAASGQVAATKIFRLLDRRPPIDYRDESGAQPEKVEGFVSFNKLFFEYPVRKEVPVLKGLRAVAKPGQTLALVGESGCGKSTIISLAERFYDPSAGVVEFDGVDVKKLNLNWLRDQIGLVNQEPDLFKTTVANNIAYGARKMDGTPVTQEMIEDAAKLANAHDFIMSLPQGYDTEVGERGSQLSGGQRQRIAIARALVRDPKLLLLDEATSALDSQSERLVQGALDAASRGRTTITVAHRLATIQSAEAIAVVKDGVIAELGTHNELMAKDGLYADMVRTQMHQGASTV